MERNTREQRERRREKVQEQTRSQERVSGQTRSRKRAPERMTRQQRERERRLQEEKRKRRRRRARRRFLIKLTALAAVCALLFGAARFGWNYLQSRQEIDPERLAEQGYPESLIELVQKNPETKDFVLGYMKYEGVQDIDISGEVTQGEIPLFLQWDERWGYENYGSDFLAVTGCGPTCLSMVLCGLSGDTSWNPLEVAHWAEENGYYVDGSGSSWELMSTGASSLGLTVSEVIFDEDHIRSTLEAGTPIICVVGPGDFTTSGHFLVLTGVDDSGDIILRDPNSRIRTEKTWDIGELMAQIKNLWAYSC